MPIISDYLRLSVTDLKRLDYLRPGVDSSGLVRWIRSDGSERASIFFEAYTGGVPFVLLSYTSGGESVTARILLSWKRSNLRPDTRHGYYYFVCPETGKLCRNLYLVNGRFISRQAFRPIYEKQAQSHSLRQNPFIRAVEFDIQAEQLYSDRYRRKYYNGRITPYGRRFFKIMQELERYRGYL